MSVRNSAYMTLTILSFLLAFLIIPNDAFSSRLMYSENFDDKSIDSPPFGYFQLQCDDSKHEDNGPCEADEWFWAPGRGGTGYAYSGAQDVATIILWWIKAQWPTDEIYMSFWMRFANYTKTTTSENENFKTLRPWIGPNGAMEFIATVADWHNFAVYADDGTILTTTQTVSTPGSLSGGWHHYEVWLKFSTGQWKIWYDGVLKMDRTYGPGKWGGYINYWTLGSIDANPGGTFMRQFDDWEMWDGMPSERSTSTAPSAPSALAIK